MSNEAETKVFGRRVRRLEDRALVTGKGRYLDDIQPAGCLAAAFVRSPHAHAAIQSIDASEALEMPGVRGVYTMEDLAPFLTGRRLVVGLPSAAIRLQVDRPVLADGEVVHVGEPIAIVIADTRSQAEDAAEALFVDFDPLPVVSDCRDALRDGAPTVHRDGPHNCLATFGFSFGDVDAAFSTATHTVSGTYEVHRGGAHSIEGRGVVAMPDPVPDRSTDRLLVWSSTQTPLALKKVLCQLLDRDDDGVRVHTPDLGGGFGPKLVTYPEEVAVAAVASMIARPVKWVEDRQEHFVATAQERDQVWDMAMAVDAEGRILGIRGTLLHDHGAYTARGLNIAYGSGVTVPLPYNVGAYGIDISVVLTNKVPTAPIRGAGQPQAAFVMERLLDKAAAAVGIDRAEIRRRNLVRADQMPCEKPLKLRGGGNIVLDSGDYPATMESALKRVDWDGFAARRQASREKGLLRGIGLANYVEGTGRGPYESVKVEISRNGRIQATTGAAAMGQGTETMIAQIVAEQLGGELSLVSVRTGDTDNPLGFGGFNSRQTVVAGASAHAAAIKVRDSMLKLAGHLLETSPDDLEVLPGRVALKGVGDRHVTFADLASASLGLPGYPLPGIETPGLSARESVVINDMAYTNGTAVAEVEVDPDTGSVEVLDFTFAHDCGRMVNPDLVDGQIVGAVAHGLGNALFEHMLFDQEAQPLTTTFADYLMVTAAEMPTVEILHTESPSPLNALGVKGVGESGVIPITPAVASAIDDALSEFGVHIARAPVSPQAVRAEILQAQSGGQAS
ncbi:xanthine dehydrogenase family protein molybdopterin-binding subunit [Microbaculum marinum]|uniref:Xanthine dehydrogenase family protein molybdopterin-binding subunit n=1 Tax=Microbaculum marinum TaxID=1764581 RepID=A0AAW9RIA4_9HYPH